MNRICIFCQRPHHHETVEHIIPRTLGNIHYVLPKGVVCRKCNNRIGRIEHHVLSSSLFLAERHKYGLIGPKADIRPLPFSSVKLRKFVLKIGYESLYLSRRKIWNSYDFTPLLDFLQEDQDDALWIEDADEQKPSYRPVPGWMDRFRLRNNHLTLEYAETLSQQLYFRFQFGKIRIALRMV